MQPLYHHDVTMGHVAQQFRPVTCGYYQRACVACSMYGQQKHYEGLHVAGVQDIPQPMNASNTQHQLAVTAHNHRSRLTQLNQMK